MSLVSGPGRGGGARSGEDATNLTLYTQQHIDYIVSLNTVSLYKLVTFKRRPVRFLQLMPELTVAH